MSVPMKLGKLSIYSQEPPSINLHRPLITWSCMVTRNIKSVISTTTMPITTRRGKVVTYYEKHPPVKLSLL